MTGNASGSTDTGPPPGPQSCEHNERDFGLWEAKRERDEAKRERDEAKRESETWQREAARRLLDGDDARAEVERLKAELAKREDLPPHVGCVTCHGVKP